MANAYDLTATGETVNLTRPFVLSFSERPKPPTRFCSGLSGSCWLEKLLRMKVYEIYLGGNVSNCNWMSLIECAKCGF